MSQDIIQAQYDALDTIANRFAQQSEVHRSQYDRLQHTIDALKNGGWAGAGANAFFSEMDGEVFPATQRLIIALEQAQNVTLEVKNIISVAEEEAARLFSESSGGDIGAGAGGNTGASPEKFIPGITHSTANTARVFSAQYMDDMIGRQFTGADSTTLNRAMEALVGNPAPAEVDRALDDIALMRGLSREEVQAQYQRFLELKAESDRIAVKNGLTPAGPVSQKLHDEYMGSTTQLRYGQVVGDALGVDPVFGALLSSSGGLVGPGSHALDLGDSPLSYHGAFHDAGGYLFNYHDIGPGYDYLGMENRDPSSPLTGQEAGIRYWNDQMGQGIIESAVSEYLGMRAGQIEDVLPVPTNVVIAGVTTVGSWFSDLISF